MIRYCAQVGGTCNECEKNATQACSCCPRALCDAHTVKEAQNLSTPVFVSDCAMYICHLCQHNTARVASSNIHYGIMSKFDMIPQELYIASGEMVSMYKPKQTGPAVDARTFSTDCFNDDLTLFKTQVHDKHSCSLMFLRKLAPDMPLQGNGSMRWYEAGKRPGRMYWLRPGAVFESKSIVLFTGLHSLSQQLYFYPRQPALAILVHQPVEEEMVVTCTCGTEGISSLHLAQKRITYVRVVTSTPDDKFTFQGVYMITKLDRQSDKAVQVSMISMQRTIRYF